MFPFLSSLKLSTRCLPFVLDMERSDYTLLSLKPNLISTFYNKLSKNIKKILNAFMQMLNYNIIKKKFIVSQQTIDKLNDHHFENNIKPIVCYYKLTWLRNIYCAQIFLKCGLMIL